MSVEDNTWDSREALRAGEGRAEKRSKTCLHSGINVRYISMVYFQIVKRHFGWRVSGKEEFSA
jgi:hypothetical protein